jgi:hypothetical protein
VERGTAHFPAYRAQDAALALLVELAKKTKHSLRPKHHARRSHRPREYATESAIRSSELWRTASAQDAKIEILDGIPFRNPKGDFQC